jgi:hypothetical protein
VLAPVEQLVACSLRDHVIVCRDVLEQRAVVARTPAWKSTSNRKDLAGQPRRSAVICGDPQQRVCDMNVDIVVPDLPAIRLGPGDPPQVSHARCDGGLIGGAESRVGDHACTTPTVDVVG